ncbi:hypothetical protein [Vibrio anguillarum]|uniref:Restriction endonuclease n=1 Tax=Vibrio anguillarum TaxID=55601 RepID=A0ABD4QZI8_VIBAN|nr:hypothetical protein [Vibrio anguillarum]ASG05397.1 hypothetical protein CEJ46_16395 [Vibrio anguillarum]MBT2920633.1 hypothetical protein [Vibrio anguillarum]
MDIVKHIKEQYSIDECFTYLKENGVNIDNTRFSKSKALLGKNTYDYEEVWKLSELADLSEVVHYLKEIDIPQDTLIDIVSGPEEISGERKKNKKGKIIGNTRARDKFHEYKVKARLKKAGFTVDESHKGNDARVILADDDFYIECKRVGSEAKIRERFNKAFEQLGDNASKGIIAIDISKIVYKMFLNDVETFQKMASPSLKTFLDNFMTEYLVRAHKEQVDVVCATMIHSRFPIFAPGQYPLINHFCVLHNESVLGKSLLSRLESSVG